MATALMVSVAMDTANVLLTSQAQPARNVCPTNMAKPAPRVSTHRNHFLSNYLRGLTAGREVESSIDNDVGSYSSVRSLCLRPWSL